jgi:HAD superfamily hydrolase (TIGR01459 family)
VTSPIPLLSGLAAVADRYDAFILDLWGVLHDGQKPYPGVPECLAGLRRAGKRVILLSNAPRRIPSTLEKLVGMGLDPALWDHIVTSGEATHQALLHPPDAWHAALGARLFHIGPPRDNDVYERLPGRTRVDSPDEADFVLNTGIDDFDETVADYEDVLQACARRRLPMVCANPDVIVVVGGKMAICAGTLAARYEELGGDVRYHGKPHPGVYATCFGLLGAMPRSRIVAIGDSLRTDIGGANAAGINAILVTGGIHREELGTEWGGDPDPDALARIAHAAGRHPSAAMPRLVW